MTANMLEQHLITLKSEDGVEVAVEGFWLQSASKVFRDMLSNKHTTSDNQPIPIDAPADVLNHFISFVKQEHPFNAYKRSYQPDLLPGVVVLAKMYDCDAVINHILMLMTINSSYIPAWTLFVLASKLDSATLAKDAICRFTLTDFDWSGGGADGGKLYFSDIDPRYIVALTRAALACCVGPRTCTFLHTYRQFSLPYGFSTREGVFQPPPEHISHTTSKIPVTAIEIATKFELVEAK